MGFEWVSWVVMPLLIFGSRILDVSIGTLRIVFINRGFRRLAPILGFIEVLIWIIVVREVMLNLKNIPCLIAYAAGFAAGNYAGIWLEEKLSLGWILFRVVFIKNSTAFTKYLAKREIGYTLVNGQGARGSVKILFTVLNRKDLNDVSNTLFATNPQAFYSIETVKSVSQGIFPRICAGSFSNGILKYRKFK